MHKQKIPQNGFTLIELVIYIGIVAIVLTATVSFTWVLMNAQVKQERIFEVGDQGSFALNSMVYETKRADALNVGTVYGANPGKIVLDVTGGGQIIFDTYEKDVTMGDVVVTITKLRMTPAGGPAEDLTSDMVNVRNFEVIDLSSGDDSTIKVNLTLEAVNPSGLQAYGAENSWETSITLRKH